MRDLPRQEQELEAERQREADLYYAGETARLLAQYAVAPPAAPTTRRGEGWGDRPSIATIQAYIRQHPTLTQRQVAKAIGSCAETVRRYWPADVPRGPRRSECRIDAQLIGRIERCARGGRWPSLAAVARAVGCHYHNVRDHWPADVRRPGRA